MLHHAQGKQGWELSVITTLPPSSSFDISSKGILVIEENIVRHYSFGGHILKQFSCESRPISAIFHAEEDCSDPMVVILVSRSLVRIFTATGEFYDIPLSFLAKCLLSSSRGVLIESEINTCQTLVDDFINFRYYILYGPESPYAPLPLQRTDTILAVSDCLLATSGLTNEISIQSIMSFERDEDILIHVHNDSVVSDSFSSSRHSPATKRMRSKSTLLRKPTSSPESFANALGISGYADTRSVSPLSFARIREIDLAGAENTEMSSYHQTLSADDSLSIQHSRISESRDYKLIKLATIKVDEAENCVSISFSRDRSNQMLVHVLSATGRLQTYCLSTTIDSTDPLLPCRTILNVSSVVHFHLGKFSTSLLNHFNKADMCGTLIIQKQEIANLVIGLSMPICTYDWTWSQQPGKFLSPSLSGIVLVTPEFDQCDASINYICLSKWTWLTRRSHFTPLTRTIWDKCLETLLVAVCENPTNSLLAASCLSYLFQHESQESILMSHFAVIILCLPFASDPTDQTILSDLLVFLHPTIAPAHIESFLKSVDETDTNITAHLRIAIALFQIFHVGLEDEFLHNCDVSYLWIQTMYAAASIFAPSYSAYYRRLLSISPNFDKIIPILDTKCGVLAGKVNFGKEISMTLKVTSSYIWIANRISSLSFHENIDPFKENISFIDETFYDSKNRNLKFLSEILSPATMLMSSFLANLSHLVEWFQMNHQTLSYTTLALSFLAVCAQYQSLSVEDILISYPLTIRLAICRSLLSHRSDMSVLQGYWIQYRSTHTHNCGAWSWDSWGVPQSKVAPNIDVIGIPKQILIALGREDFLANHGGQILSKTRYEVTDACLFNTFHNLHRMQCSFAEEQECSWIEPELENSFTHNQLINLEDLDGLDNVEALSQSRFSEDERIHEVPHVCRLLRSSKTIYLKVERTPEMTDATFRQKQQSKLLSLCRRALSYAVGRGMLTLNSLNPILAEPIPIPPLILAGRCPPTNATISLDSISPEMTLWPEYHNGVAAGLRIRRTSLVSRNWILYNRIQVVGSQDSISPAAENAHAGFLLSLGLQGHLKALSIADICDYLTRGHELTTISMLIGLAASRIGSSDPLISKSLCLHLPSLMYPADAGEFDVSPLIQTAALTGLGLLHCSSPNRLIIEFLITELTTPRTNNSDTPMHDYKESISLSAGWALGMLLLGAGRLKSEKSKELNLDIHDLRIEDRLQQCIDGGLKPQESHLFPYTHHNKNLDASKSSRVFEGNYINTNVTSPGAVLALSFMSNNNDIASHLEVPHTSFALDNIRPDLLIYRAMGSSLILWNEVDPSSSWLRSKVPKIILGTFFPLKPENLSNVDLDNSPTSISVRSSFQILLCLLSGFCWGIALKFAGSSNESAKSLILKQFRFLHSLRDGICPSWEHLEFGYDNEYWLAEYDSLKSLAKSQRQKSLKMRLKKLLQAAVEKASKPILEMCLTLMALSISIVCAGSGDLEVLRILRALHSKVDEVSFGTHMGLAMGIGLLFLAQGRASLKRDDVSIAALVLSTCPRYPSRSKDNQCHLQPLRHLYVLAVEERCLQALDVDTGESSPLDVLVKLRNGEKMNLRIPTLLPELSSIESVTSLSLHHFPAAIGSPDSHCSNIWRSPECQCSCPSETVIDPPSILPLQPTLHVKSIRNEGCEYLTRDCPLFERSCFESQALNCTLALGIHKWSYLLCLEINILRHFIRVFPCFKHDELVSLYERDQNYSLAKLLSVADSILSSECDRLICKSSSKEFLNALLNEQMDPSIYHQYSPIILSFALNIEGSYSPSEIHKKYLELRENFDVSKNGSQKIMSLVNQLSLAMNKKMEQSS